MSTCARSQVLFVPSSHVAFRVVYGPCGVRRAGRCSCQENKKIKRRCGSEKMIMSQNENATRGKSTTRHNCSRVVCSESPETLVRRSTTTTALLQAAASFLTSSTRRTKCAVFSNEARQRTEKITVPEQCRFCFVWLLCNFVFVLLW